MFQKLIDKRWVGIFCLLVLLTSISFAKDKKVTIYGVTTTNQLLRERIARRGGDRRRDNGFAVRRKYSRH